MSIVGRVCDNSRFLRKHLTLNNEQAFELERRCFSEMNFAAKPLSHCSYYSYSMDELKLPAGLNFVIFFFFLKTFVYLNQKLVTNSDSSMVLSQGWNKPNSHLLSILVTFLMFWTMLPTARKKNSGILVLITMIIRIGNIIIFFFN